MTAALLLAYPLVILLAGCGRSGTVPAAGRVEFRDGTPVRSGRIEFRGRSPQARGTGEIDAEGRFSLSGDSGTPGVPPGAYDVIVVQMILTEDLSLEAHGHGRSVPRRYADYYTSGLEASVPESGTKNLVIVVAGG